MDPPDDRQRPSVPWAPCGEGVSFQAHASDEAVIYQAGRDQHLHYSDGVWRQRRAVPALSGVTCPYPGLAAFSNDQARWFFGRDALLSDLTDNINERLTAGGIQMVVAPSGAGKSSLLRAGLLPKIAQGALPGSGRWPCVLFTPTAHPVLALANQLGLITDMDPVQVTQHLILDPNQYIRILRAALRHLQQNQGTSARVVIVVDQLEELFTLCPDDRLRRSFIDLLAVIARPEEDNPAVAVVVAGVRADFYATCANYPSLRAALQDSPLVVGPMSETELREAVLYPAQDVGLELEPGLVEVLVREFGAITTSDDAVGSFPAERLPLLAHALRATWQQRHGATLTVAGYQSTGGIQRSIAVTADRAYARLSADAQQVAKNLFLRLVKIGDNAEDTRRRLARADLVDSSADPQELSIVLDVFTQARLLTQGQNTVEITHEALLRSWPLLRRWIGTDRAGRLVQQDLEDSAVAWSRTHDASQLYRGSRLEVARSFTAGLPASHFSPIAREFVAASARQQRRGRRLRVASITGLVVLTVVALIGTFIASLNVSEANRQHAVALSRQLAAQSQAINSAEPVTARRLAAAAWRIAPTAEARDILATLVDQQRYTLVGHASGVLAITFSPDGKLLASSDMDGEVRLWDLTTRQQVREPFTGHASMVSGLAFSPDGRLLATASLDKTIRLWDVASGRETAAPFVSETELTHVLFRPDGRILATAGHDVIQLWDFNTGKPMSGPLINKSGTVDEIAFSPDGNILVARSSSVELRDSTTGQIIGQLERAGQTAVGMMFSPDGETLSVANAIVARKSTDTTVRQGEVSIHLWDLKTKKPTGQPFTVYNDSSAVRFSPNGRILAPSSGEGQLWDVASGHAIGPLLDSTGRAQVQASAFSPDSKILATSAGAVVRLWDPQTGHPFSPMLAGHAGGVMAVAFGLDGKTLASGGDDGVRIWNLATGIPIGPPMTGADLAISPDGKTLATVSPSDQIRLWDFSTGNPRDPPLVGNVKGSGVAFSPDGKILVAEDKKDNTVVRRWDLATGTSLDPPLTHAGPVSLLTFSPTVNVLATASQEEETVRLWDATTGLQLATLSTGFMNPDEFALAFSPDGHFLATANNDNGTVQLWDTASGRALGEPLNHGHEVVNGVAFSPDGQMLATLSDQSMRLWSRITGGLLNERPLAENNSFVVVFSPDGKILATAGDSTLRLWDPVTGDPLSPALSDHTGQITAAAFSPDSRILATSSDDDTVRLWLPELYLEPASTICTQLGLPTHTEWNRYAPGEPLPPPCK